jgi:hypothetical protein
MFLSIHGDGMIACYESLILLQFTTALPRVMYLKRSWVLGEWLVDGNMLYI